MRSPIAYSPRPTPLGGAGVLAASCYLGSLAVVAFLYSNPIVLAGVALAIAVAGIAAGAGRALAASARWAGALALFVIPINGLASQRGETILLRGWDLPVIGQIDISGEALVEGTILALRIGVVLAVFAVHSSCVDPDRILRLLRPLARHSALTATLVTRLVPLAVADYGRLREAQSLRGPGAAPVSRAELTRRLVAGSLDRAVDVAAALELRGYARGVPRRGSSPARSRHSWRFASCGLAIAGLGIVARVAGVGFFEAYPTVAIETGAPTLALAAALAPLAALPYAGLARRRRAGAGERWR